MLGYSPMVGCRLQAELRASRDMEATQKAQLSSAELHVNQVGLAFTAGEWFLSNGASSRGKEGQVLIWVPEALYVT